MTDNITCPHCNQAFKLSPPTQYPAAQPPVIQSAVQPPPSRPEVPAYGTMPYIMAVSGEIWRYCRHCGSRMSPNAHMCPRCGEPFESRPTEDDELGCGAIAAIWITALLIPFGIFIVIAVSSILYFSWRKESPRKARAINIHGWCAVLVAILLSVWGGLFWLATLLRLLS